MTLTALKAKANGQLTGYWNLLKVKQEAYHKKNGKYFQLLTTPQTNVVDGATGDHETRHPSDEKHQPDVDFVWATQIPFNVQINEWVGSNTGYTAVITIEELDGTKHWRSKTFIDNRVRKQDTDPDTLEPIGEPYWIGETDETFTQWAVIEEELWQI